VDVETAGTAGAAALLAVFGDVENVDLEQARKLPVHMKTNARNEKRKRVIGILPF